MPDKIALPPASSASLTPASPSALDFAGLLSACPDSVITLDRDFRLTYANPEAIRVSQLGPDGSLGRCYWDLRPDQRGTTFEQQLYETLRSRIPRRFEYFYPFLNLWVDVHVAPHADGLALFYRDITSVKRAAQARDETVKQLQQVYDATPDSILIIDRNWTFTFANQNAVDLLDVGSVLGKNLWELFPGNREEPFFSNYQRTMQKRLPTSFEAFYPDPLNRWFRVSAHPHAESSIILFFSDITVRKQAEIDRDRTAAELGQVLEVTSDAILSLDRNYDITLLNRRARELVSPAGEVLGKNLWAEFPDAVHPGSLFQENYRRAMLDRVPTHFDAFYPAPLNLWLRIEARPSSDGIIVFFRDITADRLANDALRTSENRYRVLTELNPQLIFTADPDGHITFANASLVNFIGRSEDGEPAGQTNWIASIYPEDREDVARGWTHSLRTGTKYAGQARVRRAADRQYRWLDMTALPIHDASGQIQSWLGVATDIHEQRVAVEELAASEERYRILTDLNPQFIWMGAPDGRVIYANQRFLEYIGPQHTPDGSEKWLNAFDPADRERVLRVWSRSVQTGVDYDVEARLIRNEDGTSRWFRLRASPVRDEAGGILHWLGVSIDIHDTRTFAETLHQKQLETERQRAELESIYENTPVGLALFDPVNFRYLRINDEQAKMMGLPKDQIIGKTVLEVASGVASIGELFRQVSTGKPVRDYILEGEHSTELGAKRTWNVNYFPVYDRSGNITGITTASLEITQQKKTEAALIQSEKLAAVGRLASSISHEINNPLEAITNLLYLIALDSNLPQELKVYVHMAQSELSRVSQIATQTLRFHRQAVRPTSVTASQLVGAVLNLYQGRLTNSGIRVETRYSTSNPVLCFENDIRQVLNNLIANAIDAMRTGGCLLIRAHDTRDFPSGRRGVRITIADTGQGMSPATLKRLYEPFYTTKGLNGTGLGLWISHGIVERHGGRLQVRSTQHPIHHGTIFTLFLPYVPD